MLDLLTQLGMSEKEATVYFSALQLGSATAHAIADFSKLNRTTTYLTLEQLQEQGYIKVVEQNSSKLFEAETPDFFLNQINQKRQELADQEILLKNNLDRLSALYHKKPEQPQVRYFEGEEGLVELERYNLDQLTEEGNQMFALTPIDLLEEQFPDSRFNAVSERVQKGIWCTALYTHKDGPLQTSRHQRDLRHPIYLPRELLDITETICIFPDWGVKIFNFDPQNYFGILIQSKAVAHNFLIMMKLAHQAARQLAPK